MSDLPIITKRIIPLHYNLDLVIITRINSDDAIDCNQAKSLARQFTNVSSVGQS